MIARHWRGWTRQENADAYESLLLDKILPSIRNVAGCQGGYLLRKDSTEGEASAEVEFVVIHFFESLDSLQRFAGPDYAKAVIEPEARALLSRAEPVASHYDLRGNTMNTR
jgi:hypothetical protein